MHSLLISEKLRWITSTERNRSEAFYPSLARRLIHSDQNFQDLFTSDHMQINEDIFLKDILPLYEKEIASRENYIFEKDLLKEKYLTRMREGRKYFLFGFYDKSDSNLIGGYFYSIPTDTISLAMRFFDRSVNKDTKSQVTIDFWAEWIFYDFVKSQGHKKYSLGVDHYPNIDRAGLPLYKLKVGSLPYETSSEQINIDVKSLSYQKQLVFFSNPNSNGQMSTMNCISRTQQPGGIVDELEKVTDWAGILFNKEYED